MKIKYFSILFSLLFIKLFSQEPEKVTFTNSENYDLKQIPKGKPIGMIMILPGGGETAEDILAQINLDELALEKNLIVVSPTWQDGDFGYHTEQKFLDRIAKEIVEKYPIPKDKISMGGLSGGGMLAFTYAERAVRDKNTYSSLGDGEQGKGYLRSELCRYYSDDQSFETERT